MTQILKILLLGLIVGCAGCAEKKAEIVNAPSLAQSNGNMFPQWQVKNLESKELGIRYTKSEMSPQEQDHWKNQYKQTDLIAIPVDPKFNVQLFKIRNVKEWEDAVFIAPKLFAYGAEEKGRIAPELEPGSNLVSLPFPILLTDGSQQAITGPDAITKIKLPDSILIQHLDELHSEINRIFGRPQTLSPLPGCPKKIIVKENSNEYDATPSDLAKGDYCQMNTPFSADLRLPIGKARFLLQRALYANAVEVRALYETRVAFATTRFTLEFNKQKLFGELEAALNVNGGIWADIDLHSKTTEIVKNQAYKMRLQGDFTPYLDKIVTQAMSEFFEKFAPDPASDLKPCGKAAVCVRLKQNIQNLHENFIVTWEQSTNTLTGQNYITWTKLKPLLDKSVRIGDTGRPELPNDGTAIETGLTAIAGDLLEITPSYLVREERAFNEERTELTHNHVCLRFEPVYQERCYRIPVRCHNGECFGGDEACRNVKVGDRCVQTEDQWTSITSYSFSDPKYTRYDNPVGQTQQVFDGLVLRFAWRDDSGFRNIDCPLNTFEREGDGKSLIVRLENHNICKPFTTDTRVKPMLYLINQINYPVNYKSGKYIKKWDGSVIENPTSQTYLPKVNFAGTITIKGYDIGTEISGGTQE